MLVSTEEMPNKAKNCLGLNDYRYLTGYFYSNISIPHLDSCFSAVFLFCFTQLSQWPVCMLALPDHLLKSKFA